MELEKVENIIEPPKFEFNFEVLADFCKVRNHGTASSNGTTVPPRVVFLMELAQSLGLNPELDVFTAHQRNANDFSEVVQFQEDEIDTAIDEMLHDKTEADRTEEKGNLRIAFQKYAQLTLDQLKEELRQIEHTATKGLKRLYNLMIRAKTDILNAPSENNYYNIYIKGTGRCAVMAHHDVVNRNSDNCNDNSASCINVLATKLLHPEVHVIINDAEEIGGKGARRSAQKILDGEFGEIDFVLNFELTAVGGTNFFIEDRMSDPGPLFNRILDIFPDVELYHTPFHDGVVHRAMGIDSLVINPLPRLANGELKYDLLRLCHQMDDRISLANYKDMHDFVTKVVSPIVNGQPAPVREDVETNAPIGVLCLAKGRFGNNDTKLELIEEDGVKKVKLESTKWSGDVETAVFEMRHAKRAYSAWKSESSYMKIEQDDFRNYTF